jgi:hypothetical protein
MTNELRELRFMQAMIDIVGTEHTVSVRQLEQWLNQMCGRPITGRNGNTCQLIKGRDFEGEAVFWLGLVRSS